jgi:hypothetical protein
MVTISDKNMRLGMKVAIMNRIQKICLTELLFFGPYCVLVSQGSSE